MSTIARLHRGIFTHLLHFGLYGLPLAIVATLSATPVKSVYVQPFTTATQSTKLYKDLTAELRRITAVTLVENPANADAVLDGGGEIWVQGYRSLNPRSGRLPSDGTPIYDGYLAVELKDAKGQTFWSDLVTPGNGSGDISKALARRIAKGVAAALAKGEPAAYLVAPSPPSTVLKGMGATFPAPVYVKWFTNYRIANPNLNITYDAVGSEAGVRSLLAGGADFAASDSPQAIQALASTKQDRYLFFPTVVGAVVPIINLPGISGNVALSQQALAGIYLGQITKWNDPVVRQSNPGLSLPDLDIIVVHRSDGSGTTYAWTDFLCQISSGWKSQVGSSLALKWPTGRGAEGNEGVAQMVKELGGSIGYVEYIYALQNHLAFASVANRSGEFVHASLQSMAVAARQAAQMGTDFKISIADAPGQGAYPIATFTWLVVPAQISDTAKRDALKGFLHWMLGPGQLQAAALGYLALPSDVIAKEEAAIAQVR